MSHMDYLEAGMRVFGLHGATEDGLCECGKETCKAVYKHPRASNWQHTPDWSDEQIECMEQAGHFDTGFGVLCDGYIVVDVDPRNGGMESYDSIIDICSGAGLVVRTGGGGLHVYFKAPVGIALVSHLHNLPGIDFKSSGYVVGYGSMHASGIAYERESGYPQDIAPAPQELIDILRKPDMHRSSVNGVAVDVDEQKIKDFLGYVNPDAIYDEWIRTGMAIHHALQGGGFELWDDWSRKSDKYPGVDALQRHWHSFGKSTAPVGLGTLIHYAEQGGYYKPVEFEYYEDQNDSYDTLDLSGIDLKRPPGFVGEVCAWINSQCLYPRENAAVATALQVVGSVSGLRCVDGVDGMTANMFALCVAGSSTGKEAVQQAYIELMRAAHMTPAVHGAIKSEQELTRNLIRHQAAFYMIDEFGITLRKLVNAGKSGGTPYLEGVIGLMMSVYGKANGMLPISGDLKEELQKIFAKEMAQLRKACEQPNHEDGRPKDDFQRSRERSELERVTRALQNIDHGLERPYLSVLGYTTPVTFQHLIDHEMATNGFMSRAMIFQDLETNPKRKSGFKRTPLPDSIKYPLAQLYNPGVYDAHDNGRIEYLDDKCSIPSTDDAVRLMDMVYQLFWQKAEDHKGQTGMEAIPRRGYELAAKISLILAIPSGVRTAEHVRWAAALALRDIEQKLKLAYAENGDQETQALMARICGMLDTDHGETSSVLANRCKQPVDKLNNVLNMMVERGILREDKTGKTYRGKEIVKYYLQPS